MLELHLAGGYQLLQPLHPLQLPQLLQPPKEPQVLGFSYAQLIGLISMRFGLILPYSMLLKSMSESGCGLPGSGSSRRPIDFSQLSPRPVCLAEDFAVEPAAAVEAAANAAAALLDPESAAVDGVVALNLNSR